jgi:hypothetical protein
VIQLGLSDSRPALRKSPDGRAAWRQQLLEVPMRQRTVRPGYSVDAGRALMKSLHASDVAHASLRLHQALCGFPFGVDRLSVTLPQGSSHIVRLLAVSAALTLPSPLQKPDILIDFVTDVLRESRRARASRTHQPSVTALWEHCLVLRCLGWLEFHRRRPSMTAQDVEFVMTCLTSHSPDCQHFAVKWLWNAANLKEEAAALCISIAESREVAERWGAVLALTHASAWVSDKMIKCILMQLYDREYRFQGYSLRDVAAYALMRLTRATTGDRPPPVLRQ